jgi:hypothetical protein
MSATQYGRWDYLLVPQRKFDQATAAGGILTFMQFVDLLVAGSAPLAPALLSSRRQRGQADLPATHVIAAEITMN